MKTEIDKYVFLLNSLSQKQVDKFNEEDSVKYTLTHFSPFKGIKTKEFNSLIKDAVEWDNDTVFSISSRSAVVDLTEKEYA